MKVERVVVFSAEIGEALKQEFGPMIDPEAHGALGRPVESAELQERLKVFGKRLDMLLEAVEKGKAFLQEVTFLPTNEALKTLTSYDVTGLTTMARTLEGTAKELRKAVAPETQAAATPAEAPTPQGGLVGMFKRAAAAVEVREAPPAPPAPAFSAAAEKARQTFEAALQFAGEVLAYVSPRLLLVKVAMDATGLPGRRKPIETVAEELLPSANAAGVPAPQMRWLPHLVQLFYEQMPATQKAHMALVQWDEAKGMSEEAELLTSTLATTAAERQQGLLERFNLAKFRGATYPLSHLHVSFRGTPHLQDLFPPPGG